jgi:microsomal triglyceride transfer protein large subunit
MYQYKEFKGFRFFVQIIGEVKTSLVDRLSKCANEECKQKYLRALKNLGLKDTVPALLQHVLYGTKKTSVTAMKALRSLPPASWDDDVKGAATRIYYQLGKRFDSSARTLAADILLESEPSHEVLRDILLSLASKVDPAYEVSVIHCSKCFQVWSFLVKQVEGIPDVGQMLVRFVVGIKT